MSRARVGWGLVALLALARAASAHQGGVSYATVVVRDREVEVVLQVAYEDWLPVVDLDADHDGTLRPDEARMQLPRLGAFVKTQLQVYADGVPCPGGPVDVQVAQQLGRPATLLRLGYQCPSPVQRLRTTIALFHREHPGHRVLATIGDGGALLVQHVFGPGSETFETAVAQAAATTRWQAVREFLALGVEHIFTGYDHVLFLLGLLLVAPRLGDLLKIVTAFTAAHTVTLVLATLGYVRLEVRLVESVIALSIAYVAIENLLSTEHRRRWLLAFGFGLVHGFGFSNVLREMAIPRAVLGWSLASFNVGVELGQVTIVSLLYPLLRWSRRHTWNTWAVRAASVVIGLMGLYWFVERALLSA